MGRGDTWPGLHLATHKEIARVIPADLGPHFNLSQTAHIFLFPQMKDAFKQLKTTSGTILFHYV